MVLSENHRLLAISGVTITIGENSKAFDATSWSSEGGTSKVVAAADASIYVGIERTKIVRSVFANLGLNGYQPVADRLAELI